MTYDKHGNVILDVSDDEWRTQQALDLAIIHTGGSEPVVGEPSEAEIEFAVMLEEQIVRMRLRVANGWLQDAEITREDRKDLLS